MVKTPTLSSALRRSCTVTLHFLLEVATEEIGLRLVNTVSPFLSRPSIDCIHLAFIAVLISTLFSVTAINISTASLDMAVVKTMV